MIMTENEFNYFNEIKDILEFPSKEIFYVISIIVRKKDLPENDSEFAQRKWKEHFIRHYFIRSVEEFLNLEQSIKDICNKYRARAYFSLDAKNIRKVLSEQMKEEIELLAKPVFDGSEILKYKKNFDGIPRKEETSESSLRYIHVDLDKTANEGFVLSQKLDTALFDKFNVNFKVLQTPNGYHFFRKIRSQNGNVNLQELGNLLTHFRNENNLESTELEMKKNSMVLLYKSNLVENKQK